MSPHTHVSPQARDAFTAALPPVLFAGSVIAAALFIAAPRVFAAAGQADTPGHWLAAEAVALALGILYAGASARALGVARGAALHALVLVLAFLTLPLSRAAQNPSALHLIAPCFACAASYALMRFWAVTTDRAAAHPLLPALCGAALALAGQGIAVDADEAAHLWAALYSAHAALIVLAAAALSLAPGRAPRLKYAPALIGALAAPCALIAVLVRDGAL